jgi:lipopolysaccharide heptosyltransferase I
MKVLIVKTSSMGDVIHTLPAVSDAVRAHPGLQLDWIVERHYAPIVQWHPAISRAIPIQFRQWRKHWWSAHCRDEFKQALRQLRLDEYDIVIDAQGLPKSLLWVWLSRHRRSWGYDRQSIRGTGISWLYGRQAHVSWQLSAVQRIRHLFAQALDYPVPESMPDYGIVEGLQQASLSETPYLIFFPNSSCANRYWPVAYWQQLIHKVRAAGFAVKLSAGSLAEADYCRQIIQQADAQLLDRLSIAELGVSIANAVAVVSLDTGLGHLATAMHKPTIALHGPTRLAAPDAWQTPIQATLPCAPCLKKVCQLPGVAIDDVAPCLVSVSAESVWQVLHQKLIEPSGSSLSSSL